MLDREYQILRLKRQNWHSNFWTFRSRKLIWSLPNTLSDHKSCSNLSEIKSKLMFCLSFIKAILFRTLCSSHWLRAITMRNATKRRHKTVKLKFHLLLSIFLVLRLLRQIIICEIRSLWSLQNLKAIPMKNAIYLGNVFKSWIIYCYSVFV